MNNNMENKRSSGRVNKYFSAWFSTDGHSHNEMVILKNISSTGAYFWSEKKLSAGSYGILTINFKPNKAPIRCKVKVIRSGKEKSRTIFPTAVEFVKIDAAHQSRIADLIKKYNEKIKMIIESGAIKFI